MLVLIYKDINKTNFALRCLHQKLPPLAVVQQNFAVGYICVSS